MDDRLEKALEFSNYRVTLYNQHEALKLRMRNALTHACNGGTFKITQELIGFCNTLILDEQTEAVLLDINELPILIPELQEFYDTIYSKYFEALNDYSIEYEKLRKARKVSAIVDIDPKEF